MTNKKWVVGGTFASSAKDCLERIDEAIDTCDAHRLANLSACVFGNSEAAFNDYNRGLKEGMNEDEMQSLKGRAESKIYEFEQKCECHKKSQYTPKELKKAYPG